MESPMWFTRVTASLFVLIAIAPVRADVVINEIFYHAPDDLENLQFIELHNTGNQAVDLAGWKLAKAVKFTFPAKTTLEANGYIVLCKDLKEFKSQYGFDAAAQYSGSLSHSSDQIDLMSASGKKVDSVKYKTRAPWPIAADGYSSSLERICPTATVTGPENWAPSPMAPGIPKPAGSPGKKNASFAMRLPPIIDKVTFTPKHAAPDQEITVEAEVRGVDELSNVELRYRIAGSGFETQEQTIRMTKSAKGAFAAKIPPQKAKQIVRFRVRALDKQNAERTFPHPHELRPALSIYVHDPFKVGDIPFGLIMNVGLAEFRAAKAGKGPAGGYGGTSPNPPARGNSAFVRVDPKSGEPTLFDFINIGPRSGGQRIRFHKDQPLGDITSIVPLPRHFLAIASRSENVHGSIEGFFERGGMAVDLSGRGTNVVLAEIPRLCQMTSALGLGNPPFFHRDPKIVADTATNRAGDMLDDFQVKPPYRMSLEN